MAGLLRRLSARTLVLVTHHVEEIMPVFSHALLSRKGEVLAKGEKENVLPMQLRTKAGRFQLRLLRKERVIA